MLSSYTEFRLFLVVVFSLLGIMTIISFLISCWLITRKKLASLYSLWSLGLAITHNWFRQLSCLQARWIGQNVRRQGVFNWVFGVSGRAGWWIFWWNYMPEATKCLTPKPTETINTNVKTAIVTHCIIEYSVSSLTEKSVSMVFNNLALLNKKKYNTL